VINFGFSEYDTDWPADLVQKTSPSSVASPDLVIYNTGLAEQLGVPTFLSKDELSRVLSGNELAKNSNPFALAYAGHQFGHFVPVLGDGRALILGTFKKNTREVFELQLKGSGPTVFSRRGDGRSALGPALREFLVSEFMSAVGITTTRSLAVVKSSDSVQREQSFPMAILSRVSRGHIRVGTFEYLASQNNIEGLKQLVEFSIKRGFYDEEIEPQDRVQFFKCAVNRQVELLADWMSVGFIHGVMNTDNTSVIGETLDYGPCAFMDNFQKDQVYSFIDRNGRYAFNNQPKIAQWNLARLAECLLVIDSDPKIVKEYQEILESFLVKCQEQIDLKFCQKLGFLVASSEAKNLVLEWLDALQTHALDFTLGFRGLNSVVDNPFENQLSTNKFYPTELGEFFEKWQSLLEAEGDSPELIVQRLNKSNPINIPRNHILQKALELADSGDFGLVNEFYEALKNPYSDDSRFSKFQEPPKENERIKNTFCGT